MDLVIENVGRRSEVWGAEGTPTAVGERSLNGYERNVLFRNQGDGTFVDVGYVTGANRIEDARGVAVADFDRDGQLDLLIENFAKPAALLMGRGATGHWLQIDLDGLAPNRDAVGAVVTITTSQGSQTRQVSRGNAFLSCSSPVLHFGLGNVTTVDRVTIRWPSGRRQFLTDVAADQRLYVRESTAPDA